MIAFAVADILVKLLGGFFPPAEIVFLRSAAIIGAATVFGLCKQRRLQPRRALSISLALRCIFDSANTLAMVVAIIHMNLAEAYGISLTAPLLITLFGFIFYGEKVGYRRWGAIFVGLTGALFIIKPDLESFDYWALLALLASVFSAARETVTRKVELHMSSLEVTLYSAILTGTAAASLPLSAAWALPSASQIFVIIALAIAWLIGSVLLVEACRLTSLYLVGLFRYAILLWGGIGGYFVFGGVPDRWSILGIVLIGSCGLYSFYRETLFFNAVGH